MWWYSPVIRTLRREMQEDLEFEVFLGKVTETLMGLTGK
jgi:hypothetical protein